MILKERKNLIVPHVKSVSLQYMQANEDYFGEALALCDQFGISDIISINKDFDAKLVTQFFATVYFSSRDDLTMIWMCNDERVRCTWKAWIDALNIPVSTADDPTGLCPHTTAK